MDAPRAAPRDAPAELVVLDAIDAQISPRDAVLRFLPHRGRRMVGAWCFVDVYGPWAIGAGEPGMTVPPHSHIGLQTLSWVLDGEVLHRDSLGTTATVTPGYAALMTAGLGIAHSENTPDGHCGRLHGAQLWIALPDAVRARPPSFELVGPATQVPIEGATAHVFAGTLAGRSSRLTEGSGLHSPLVGAELRASPLQVPAAAEAHEEAMGPARVPLEAAYEHLLLPLTGTARLGGHVLQTRVAAYLPPGRDAVELELSPDARVLLLGGLPFDEEILMWWNFVARTHEEIVEAREQWNAGSPRFGEVGHYPDGSRLAAPPLPTVRLKPRGRAR